MADIITKGAQAWADLDSAERLMVAALYKKVYGVDQAPAIYPPLFTIFTQMYFDGSLEEVWNEVVGSTHG